MNEPVHKKFFIKKNKLKPVISSQSIDDANNPRQFIKSYTAMATDIIYKKIYLIMNI